jgi:short subunit dehydrogenase-like uncharacterized protein
MSGATEEQRRFLRAEIWGEVIDTEGNKIVGTIFTPNVYTCTGLLSLKGIEILMDKSQPVSPGVSRSLTSVDGLTKLDSFFYV